MRITFSGNLGDPIYNTELISIVKYLKSQNPSFQLVIVTNGSYKSSVWWEELAQYLTPFDEIIFSIDGWDQESNEKYRVNSDWASIITGLKIMIKSKACVRWSTIIFKYNSHHIDKIKQMAKDMGVDHFHIVLSERFGSHLKMWLNSDGVDHLEPEKKYISDILRTKRLKWRFPTNKSKGFSLFYKKFDKIYDNLYSQTKSEYKNNEILPSCKYGYRGIYINAEGVFSPCCWTGVPYGEKRSPLIKDKVHKYSEYMAPYLKELNLNHNSMESVLSHKLWGFMEEGWREKGKAYVVCEKKCLRAYG